MNNKNFTLFIAELGKYFMEFLETDFHKRRIPKRNIKYKDSNNLLLGVNLRKYESFQKDLSKLVVSGFPNGKVLTIKKNKYVTKISRNSLNILDIQLGNINSDDIDDTLNSIKNIILANSSKYQKQPETGLTICEEEISSVIRDNFITPLVTSIESTIETQSLQGIDALFNIEENLLDILLKPLTGRVSELYNSHLIRNEPVEAYALAEVLDKDFIISSISDYFKSFLVDDLYNEIQQLFNNKNILDKKTIYLYICDINYNNNRYPIFYIPIEVTKLQASFRLSFDSSIYINKKAIGFIVEKYNSEKGVRGKISSIDERILYLGDYDDSNPIINYLQTIVGDLLDHFSIPESIDLKDIPGKSTQSLFIQISYSLNICIFDKSDEALINDYEELLELLFSGNEISEFFSNLISNFIMSDPKSIISDIEDDWNKIDTDKKLVPICPIPMNREQRLILNAINHDKGKYILA